MFKSFNLKTAVIITVILIASTASGAAQEGKLYFTFISSAYYMDKNWGQGMPLDGIKRVADIAHSNGVPVTWLVSPKSAELGKDLFKEYHDNYGDAFGYMIQTTKAEEDTWGGGKFFLEKLPFKKLAKRISDESDSVKRSLPWAEIMIGGGGQRSNKIVYILDKLGYTGLWGHCWEQTLTDEISDRGAPWGFYYISPDAFKAPNRNPRGLVAVEWTARDLNLSFRTGKPETYSTDPDDVRRANICRYRKIDYWKRLVDEYARNAKYNRIVPLAVHQEAHEMEMTDKYFKYDPDVIDDDAQMLDELFKYIRSIGAEVVNANDAVKIYRELYETTPPTYALFNDILLEEYPEIFIYFDVNGQLFFDRGRIDPVFIRNYIGELDPDVVDFAGVPDPPRAACRETSPGKFGCEVTADRDLAYGLAFRGDYKSISVSGAENAITEILDGELAFFAWVLKPGANKVEITLK